MITWVIIGFLASMAIWNMIDFMRKSNKPVAKIEESKTTSIDIRYIQERVGRKCPPHQWVWHQQPGYEDEGIGFLKCADCLKTPQMIFDENTK